MKEKGWAEPKKFEAKQEEIDQLQQKQVEILNRNKDEEKKY